MIMESGFFVAGVILCLLFYLINFIVSFARHLLFHFVGSSIIGFVIGGIESKGTDDIVGIFG